MLDNNEQSRRPTGLRYVGACATKKTSVTVANHPAPSLPYAVWCRCLSAGVLPLVSGLLCGLWSHGGVQVLC